MTPALMPVTPRPTPIGVFGSARTTRTPAGTCACIVAVVTPTATLTTTASGARSPATSSSRSTMPNGFTPSTTSPAPRTAARLASGSVSVAVASNPLARCAAAEDSERVVTTTVSGATPEARRPCRTAPDMEPTPSMATRGSSMVMATNLATTGSLGSWSRSGERRGRTAT